MLDPYSPAFQIAQSIAWPLSAGGINQAALAIIFLFVLHRTVIVLADHADRPNLVERLWDGFTAILDRLVDGILAAAWDWLAGFPWDWYVLFALIWILVAALWPVRWLVRRWYQRRGQHPRP